MTLAGKVALVTGSAQGIGRGIALRLADEGADLVVDDRPDNSQADAVAQLIRAKGRRCMVYGGDLANTGDDQRLITEGVRNLGQIDILVNNAGLERRAPFCEVTEADFDLVLNVNLRGTFFTTQAFVKHLLETKRTGRIINISSVHEELPFPHFSTYCASKGALKMFMRNLAIELAPSGILVNNIAPGAIETPINTRLMHSPELLAGLLDNIPLKRLGTPEDVAGLVAFLCSADSNYVTGSTLYVDGGLLWNYSEQ